MCIFMQSYVKEKDKEKPLSMIANRFSRKTIKLLDMGEIIYVLVA